MSNYYNENDPKAAAWLRELIKRGLIPPGDVDERSIEDVKASDLEGYTQCHWFAGIGGWPLALRIAGVSPDIPLWTGSAPCQPLSCAGKREGEMDERHLWPVWYSLIAECRPSTIYGEQTASGDGPEWLDGISLDLEELGYAIGPGDLPAACVGAPDIRQRLWFVADAERDAEESGRSSDQSRQRSEAPCAGTHAEPRRRGMPRGLADSDLSSSTRQPQHRRQAPSTTRGLRNAAPGRCGARGLADANGKRLQEQRLLIHQGAGREADQVSEATGPGEANHWIDFELCWRRKPGGGGEWCRIEPGTFPLASRLPEVVALLRGYGNSINPWVAAKFIRAHVEARDALASAGHRGNRP